MTKKDKAPEIEAYGILHSTDFHIKNIILKIPEEGWIPVSIMDEEGEEVSFEVEGESIRIKGLEKKFTIYYRVPEEQDSTFQTLKEAVNGTLKDKK